MMNDFSKRLRWIFLSLLFVPFQTLFCGVHETIPAYHWTTGFIHRWVVKEYFPQRFLTYRMISRGDVARELIRLKTNPSFMKIATPEDQAIFKKLQGEFLEEILYLEQEQAGNLANFSIYFDNRSYTGKVARNRIKLNGPVEWTLSPTLGVFFNFTVDQNFVDDPTYVGNQFEDLRAFTEQGFLVYRGKWAYLKVGRDYLRWGPGISGALLLSDASRSYDQFSFLLHSKKAQFQSAVVFLDTYENHVRFLAAHRLSYRIFENFELSLSETAVYGNTTGTVDLRFHNPFNVFHEYQMNNKAESNELGSIDFQWILKNQYRVFGELLVDDIQVQKKDSTDLEPDEIGFLLGAEAVGIWDPRFDLNIEYVQVRNRTYNTRNPRKYQRYLHRGKPIGYDQGNDFDRWQIGAKYWVNESFWTAFQLVYLRQGKGRIENDFDEPWLQKTVAQGYSEPFPSGVVQKTIIPRLQLSWIPKPLYHLSLEAEYFHHDHFNNISGKSRNKWEGKLTFTLQPRWNWSLD